jgi:hypothetical protein
VENTGWEGVTPTLYKNKFFYPNRSAYEKPSKNKSCIGSIAWQGILYFSKILGEPRRI